MALKAGMRFGPFEIAEPIGAGGMGEVYRATDTTLERDVAIKVLPASFAEDPGRVERFEREAKTLAALNHANIAQIYGLERSDGTTALVMELVDGPTLEDRIAKGPLPADMALGIAMQIADALEAAHSQNIIHRDLKPANIKLKPDGTVKVLDFGIAKAFAPENLVSGAQSPIMTTPATQVGVILGTAAYMSPEQAKGKAVDQRTDIWAFGCVLYEMLTGQLAFGAEDVPTTLARVIANDTNLDSLPAAVSPAVRKTVELCLQKDVRRRVRDIGDVKLALEGAFETDRASEIVLTTVQPLWRRALPIAAAAAITGAIVGFAGDMLRSTPESEPVPGLLSSTLNVRRTVIGFEGTEPVGDTFLPAHVALSVDGRRLVYAAQIDSVSRLYVREVDQLEARPMSGTEGALYPFFSPDGEWVAYYSDPDRKLKRASTRGGLPQTLADATFSAGGSWVTDDAIVFATGDPSSGREVFQIPATGGTPEIFVPSDPDVGYVNAEVLPGGEAVLYVIRAFPGGAGPARDGRIAVLSRATGEVRTLIEGGHWPKYAPTGHIVFVRSGDLWAVPFDLDRLQTNGQEVPVVEGVAQDGARGGAAFAFSNDGLLVYAPGGETLSGGGLTRKSLVWVDREGHEEPLSTDSQIYWNPRLSPDGRSLALAVSDGDIAANADIRIMDLQRGTLSRLSFDPGDHGNPIWTPDGQQVIFWSGRDADDGGIFRQASNGGGSAERLTTSTEIQRPVAIDPTGSLLVFESGDDLFLLSLDDEPAAEPLLDGAFNEGDAAISPDGRWLAYSSDETGRDEIYVRPFPDVNEGGRWQISVDGGTEPVWGPDGTALIFRDGNAVLSVDVEADDVITAGTPGVLFRANYWINPNSEPNYDVGNDGRLLMMRVTEQDQLTSNQYQLIAVENWFQELERLAPPAE